MARIVVIDAVFDAAQLVKRVLEEAGHQVRVFTDEEEALLALADNPAEMVILDTRLKKSSGLRVLQQIRDCAPETRSLVLTADTSAGLRREALSAGAGAYCVKPVDIDELAKTVNHLLSGA
jgi:DNA-binding response OmpR family regulator